MNEWMSEWAGRKENTKYMRGKNGVKYRKIRDWKKKKVKKQTQD